MSPTTEAGTALRPAMGCCRTVRPVAAQNNSDEGQVPVTMVFLLRLLSAHLFLGPTLPASDAMFDDTCAVPVVTSPEVDEWSDKITGAIVGADACYAAPAVFTNSDCNIFVGRVMEAVYNIDDFRGGPSSTDPYLTSNEISDLLVSGTLPDWKQLGSLRDHSVLVDAQRLANDGVAVLVVWRNESGAAGHIALIGPGPMTKTGSLGEAPVSASFFQGHPEKNYIGKPISCAFNSIQQRTAQVFAHAEP